MKFKQLLGMLLLATSLWAQKPIVTPPQVFLNTTYTLPTGGTTWNVSTAVQFSNALTTSQPGDVIVLTAGGTFTGNFILPLKPNPSKKWIYIISSSLGKLPAGVRVSPASAGYMPKVVSPNSTAPLTMAWGANYYRLAGLEVTQSSNYPTGCGVTGKVNCLTYQLITTPWAQAYAVPDHVYIDRCYFHGDATHDIQAAVQANFTNFALVESYVSAIHNHGTDSNAVGAFNSTGPFKINDNFLEAAGENIIFGGSGQNFNIGVPSDIEIQYNILNKPLTWISLSLPSYQSQANSMVEKNAFELKSAQRVLFNANTINNVWYAGQDGYALEFTVRTGQSGDFAVVNDVTVTNNILNNIVAFVNTLGADDTCANGTEYPACKNAGSQDRWNITNNLIRYFDPLLPGGLNNVAIAFQPGYDHINNHVGQIKDVVFQHNSTVDSTTGVCWGAVYFGTASLPTPPTNGLTSNVWILDNALCDQTYGPYGYGLAHLIQYMGVPATPPFDINGRYFGNLMQAEGTIYPWPPNNTATTTPFVFDASGNLTSPACKFTTDGTQCGYHSSFGGMPISNTKDN